MRKDFSLHLKNRLVHVDLGLQIVKVLFMQTSPALKSPRHHKTDPALYTLYPAVYWHHKDLRFYRVRNELQLVKRITTS